MSTAIIIVFLIAIVGALGAGMIFMLKDSGGRRRMVFSLSLRIGLSLALIIFLVAGSYYGWIQPHGVRP